MGLENLWYLAHPVAPCERYTLQQNLAHTLKVARIAWDAGFRVIMPWYSHCHFLDDANTEHRRDGLECDKQIIRHLRKIIYTGDRLSKGMQEEAAVSRQVNAVAINLIGVPDRELKATFRSEAIRLL